MREPKYRGIWFDIDGPKWAYGTPVKHWNSNGTFYWCIHEYGSPDGEGDEKEIIPETLGQFTGLTDKNGVDIYEDDIVEFIGGTCNFLHNGIYSYQVYKIGDIMIVQKLLSGFTLAGTNMVGCDIPNRVGKVGNYDFWKHHNSLKVIGNIHDNQELMKGN